MFLWQFSKWNCTFVVNTWQVQMCVCYILWYVIKSAPHGTTTIKWNGYFTIKYTQLFNYLVLYTQPMCVLHLIERMNHWQQTLLELKAIFWVYFEAFWCCHMRFPFSLIIAWNNFSFTKFYLHNRLQSIIANIFF